ncbi:MAG: ATP-binding protein [Treponemataceae bacterium]|nr:ATP-binding protein [Treponemataceae bacterium]
MTDLISNMGMALHSLTIFSNLLKDKVVSSCSEFFDSFEEDKADIIISKYSQWINNLYESGNFDFSKYLADLVLDDENAFINSIIRKQTELNTFLTNNVAAELSVIEDLMKITSSQLKKEIRDKTNFQGYLGDFENSKINLKDLYSERINNISKLGFGIYSRYYVFHIENKKITPVTNPDTIRLDQLIDYDYQKKKLIENTLALIEGKPAANVLLTGDAGTGKSSSIKAVVNEFHDRGLRILEIKKEQIPDLGPLLSKLAENPLKFIIFIDDLSFEKDDDTFSSCKAILEGSVLSKSDNVVIYATSNRRHLVKETFSDREGDDIHRNDTIQQIVSLSERFGLHLTYDRPNKNVYLDIVHHLAQMKGIEISEELDIKAEQFALSKSNRSARCAKQFVNMTAAGRD